MELSSPLPTLLAQMNVTQRWRRNGLPIDPGEIIIFTHADKIEEACQDILSHSPGAKIIGFHAHKYNQPEFSFSYEGQKLTIPHLAADCMNAHPECAAVLHWKGCVAPDLLYHLQTAIKSSSDIVIFPRLKAGEAGRKWDEDFYRRHSRKLEGIYENLSDNDSKLTFASVIKSIARGDIEWLWPPSCPEYEHDQVKAAAGDIVIDAGLFDSAVLRNFALAAGSCGHVYDFEPEARNYEFVLKTLHRYGNPGNITIPQKGLWSCKTSLHISNEGASGKICPEPVKESSLCKLTDLDSFVEESSLEQVNLIKMDIEGAEMEALRGAEKTIRRFQPKLQICAYHRIDDLIEIYEFIKDICPEYKVWFTAHAPYLNEYVYYFRAGNCNG